MSAERNVEASKDESVRRITPNELRILARVRNEGLRDPAKLLLPAKVFELEEGIRAELGAGRTFREALENVMLRSSWRLRNVADAKLPYYAEVAHELFKQPYDPADGWFDSRIMETISHEADQNQLDAFHDPDIRE